MTIRVLVVDDHAVVRSGLRRIIDAHTHIVDARFRLAPMTEAMPHA